MAVGDKIIIARKDYVDAGDLNNTLNITTLNDTKLSKVASSVIINSKEAVSIDDSGNLQLTNALCNYTKGIDKQGFIQNSLSLTKSQPFSGISDGLKWIGFKEDGSLITTDIKPTSNIMSKGYIFNINKGKWYKYPSSLVTSIDTFGDGSLIAKYNFDGDLTDLMGNYNGTWVGSPSYTTGKFLQGVNPVGDRTSPSFPFDILKGNQSRTISMFVNFATADTTTIFGLNYNGQRGFGLYYTGNGTVISNGDGTSMSQNQFHIFNGGANNADNTANISYSGMPLNTWVHLAITLNTSNSTVEIFVDGTSIGSVVLNNMTIFNTNYNFQLFLGCNHYNGNIDANGTIFDQLEFYNRVLTASEINSLKNQTLGFLEEQDPISFFKYPVMITSETVQYIDYTDSLNENYMDSLTIENSIKCDNYQGKNACTAWVNFDGTTTPPTIRDSFNVKDVIRIEDGFYRIYFNKKMDRLNYTIAGDGHCNIGYISPFILGEYTKVYVDILIKDNGGTLLNTPNGHFIFFGGKN